MALELYKIFVQGTTTTETNPTVEKFFFVTTTDTAAGADLTITADNFVGDDGTVGVTLPALATNNSYFNVYINGVLQQQDNSAYTPGGTGVGQLVFTNPVGSGTIFTGTPVVLQVTNFAPTSNTTFET